MGIKLIFESKLYIVEKDQSTLPDDERSISWNVAKRKYTWYISHDKKSSDYVVCNWVDNNQNVFKIDNYSVMKTMVN